jgi:ABC-type transporter Mla subunit MlaD
LARLISTAGRTARAIASRRTDLRAAVANTAKALGALAAGRVALSDDLARAPAVLKQATPTLAVARSALIALAPDLRSIPAAAQPLAVVLSRLTPTAARLRPAIDQLDRLLPSLHVALTGLAPLRPVADSALSSTATALKASMHIFQGLREYGSDLANGVFAGLGGITSAAYDAIGHYVRLELMLSPQTNSGGLLQTLLGNLKLIPGLSGRWPSDRVRPA